MRLMLALTMLATLPFSTAMAQPLAPAYDKIIERAIDGYVLPRYAVLSAAASQLSHAADTCGGDETTLQAAYHDTFDAWLAVSHIRMGPSEQNDAAFAIAFWPDPKGFTAKTLRSLIRSKDVVVDKPGEFSEVSIAARGLFGLERLLFDPAFAGAEDEYRCRLLHAITGDLAALAQGIETGWRTGYADALRGNGVPQVFGDDKQTVQALYGAMKTGLEFTLTARVDRPLGLDSRARPNRAEAWRAGRPNRNIQLSLLALEDMFETVFAPAMPHQAANIVRAEFYTIRRQADTLPAPLRTLINKPLGRGKVITLRFALVTMLEQMEGLLRPSLGLSLSFNTLDGD